MCLVSEQMWPLCGDEFLGRSARWGQVSLSSSWRDPKPPLNLAEIVKPLRQCVARDLCANSMFTCFPHLYSKTYHKFGIFVSLLNRLLERNINTDQSNFTLDFPFTSPAAKTLLSSGSLHSSNPPSRAVTKLRLTFAGETNKSKTEARASIYGTERDQTLCKFASDTQTQP